VNSLPNVRRPICAGLAALALAGLTLAGCPFLPDHVQDEDGAAISFLAQNGDFGDFRSWQSVVVGTAPIVDGHQARQRRVYVNAAPVDDEGAFPVGTIIVKEGTGFEAADEEPELHAMVKRGSRFNLDGAVGWEWFELGLTTSNIPLIQWRGEQPPDGEDYGCVAGVCEVGFGQCNDCHAGARDNDFVLSPALTLGAIEAELLP
jgi:hypothetical protein